jgi:hypothetical protein
MFTAQSYRRSRGEMRFSVWNLLGFVTLCALLCVLLPWVGLVSVACLMLTALSIAARQGEMALTILALAVMLQPVSHQATLLGPLLTLAAGAGIGYWSLLQARRRQWPSDRPVDPHTGDRSSGP